ncbi:hypothetical protein OTU49_004671 [Cherax quadricarinatus]|uniref:Uncharacterized protein n=1 Tax=Cherax quadricarinatus TaxID=27406 RepID=A0AAW0WWY4_CHEQU|nr:uncharacterized protein LOC128694287 isoform X1 [Cherax quadricarinatus]XP_053640333.1 uncharacterized protein LOC128694287 isoform X1 [Cherax quadricarinatus]
MAVWVAAVTSLLVVATTLVDATPAITHGESSTSDLRHLYKGTYVLYGNGRRSERDLPECASAGEACNLAHRRFWLTPITERLCRCADRSECPLHFNGLNNTLSQHVSNRAQLKFCGRIMEEMSECQGDEVALKLRRVERENQPFPGSAIKEGADVHTNIMCRCPWPNSWIMTKTEAPSPTETIYLYTCNQLPKCKTGEECGHIRADTLESYYTCSCPQHHLCIFKGPQLTHITTQLHFHGQAYSGKCTSN